MFADMLFFTWLFQKNTAIICIMVLKLNEHVFIDNS